MIEFVLIDLDDTILDFHKAERNALQNTLQHFGLTPNEETIDLYLQINQARFIELFRHFNKTVDGSVCAAYYLNQLSLTHDYLPGAETAIADLSKKYQLFIASNGNASVQGPRLAASGLHAYIRQAFVSEALGENKPNKAYFDICFSCIPGFDPQKAIMVGDSLTSDIQGGINAGIRTCWFNPAGKPNTTAIQPDYEIHALSELETLLEAL